jgi:ArsR family transcriptional regulator, arsenate/arsenite/antimonite-responsive transcriptional repressor
MAKVPLSAEERARVFKALADPRRVGIVDALATHGAMCGTELAERLDVSLALLCHHWDVLVDAGLVKKRRVGQLRMCTLDQARLQEATRPFRTAGVPEAVTTRAAPAAKKAPSVRKAPSTSKAPAKRKARAGKATVSTAPAPRAKR